ncbi:MAG: glycosyltransferase family 2 protein [Gemmatimonadales bacterium]|nr:MAG: glycosyltransferase family 2 protein [Gemmatimonadales bacterium]
MWWWRWRAGCTGPFPCFSSSVRDGDGWRGAGGRCRIHRLAGHRPRPRRSWQIRSGRVEPVTTLDPAPDSGLSAAFPGVAAVIPAINEEGSIGRVVRELRERGVGRVVVADNGSSDGTPRVAAEAGAEIATEPRLGYGRACLSGIALLEAGREPPSVVVFVDGDGADALEWLPRLLEPALRDEADLVIGRRTDAGEVGNARAHARIGSRWVLRAARILHGLQADDMGPFRAVRWETLQAMRMDDPTWGWTLQMQLRAHHLGARTLEIEVPRRARTAGRSKVSGSLGISLRAGVRMGWTLIRERILALRQEGPHDRE